MHTNEWVRDAIARAIYKNSPGPGPLCPWDELPAWRKTGWLSDADCVINVLETLSREGRPIEAGGGASVAKPPLP